MGVRAHSKLRIVTDITFSPKQAALDLEVSGTALRRAAQAYELTFGELKRDARGGREFTGEALERLRLAFAAVHAGRVASVEVALTLLREGDDLPIQVQPPAPRSSDDGLVRAMTAEIVGELRADIQAMRQENAALHSEVADLRSILAGVAVAMQAQGGDLRNVDDRLDRLTGAVLGGLTREKEGDVVREEIERLRVMLHGTAPATPAPRPGLLARLVVTLLGSRTST